MKTETKKVRVEFVETNRYEVVLTVPKGMSTDKFFFDDKLLIKYLDAQVPDWHLRGDVDDRDVKRVEEIK